jgi:hypothetical protein
MVYVTDKKAASIKANFTDFKFNIVSADKKALWHSKEDAYYGISCFIKDYHADDPAYTIDRYDIIDE